MAGIQAIDEKAAALKNTELFGSLNDDVIKRLASIAVIRHLARGQTLYSEHEDAHYLYVVMRGELRSIRENAHGREQVLSTERRGAVLALAPNFNGGKFYSTVIADELSDVLCIHREDVHRFCHEHQEVLWCVARVMAHRVRHYAELVETLALRNVDQRVADYLLSLAREFGTKTERGLEVELKSTRTEIATQVGSAREVVSRVLHHLQKLGLIQLQEARLIVIPDAKALGAFAGRRGPILGESPEKLSSEIV